MENTDNSILDIIMKLIIKYYGEEIDYNTPISSLNFTIDDNLNFLLEFATIFDVDMTQFDVKDYFLDDGSYTDSLVHIIKSFFGTQKKYRQITVLDLLEIAKTKKWVL
jgi:hypothetical protein